MNTNFLFMQVEIRAAEPGEEASLLPAWEWLFEPPGQRPASWDAKRAALALREAIESRDSVVLLAEGEDGTLVGFCTAYFTIHAVRFGSRAWVEELAVHPEHRSRGIGARLLEAARAWARERGASHLKLDSSTARDAAHRFYEREQPSGRSLSYVWEL
jgi:GNAT superfamily N-acetyltransferase